MGQDCHAVINLAHTSRSEPLQRYLPPYRALASASFTTTGADGNSRESRASSGIFPSTLIVRANCSCAPGAKSRYSELVPNLKPRYMIIRKVKHSIPNTVHCLMDVRMNSACKRRGLVWFATHVAHHILRSVRAGEEERRTDAATVGYRNRDTGCESGCC